MRKGMWKLLLAAVAVVGLAGCGTKVETQEVDYDMTFENQTGKDVSKVEIRYAEGEDWSEITLTDGIWKDSYQMPVSMEGNIPIAPDGWQVQMTFAEEKTTGIWDGVCFSDETTFVFSYDDAGNPMVVPMVDAEEVPLEEMDDPEEDTVGEDAAVAEAERQEELSQDMEEE